MMEKLKKLTFSVLSFWRQAFQTGAEWKKSVRSRQLGKCKLLMFHRKAGLAYEPFQLDTKTNSAGSMSINDRDLLNLYTKCSHNVDETQGKPIRS